MERAIADGPPGVALPHLDDVSLAAPVHEGVHAADGRSVVGRGVRALRETEHLGVPVPGQGSGDVGGQTLARRAWSDYSRWYRAQSLPQAYFSPRVWRFVKGRLTWTGRLYGMGFPAGKHPTVLINGGRPASAPLQRSEGVIAISIPLGARSASLDGIAARPVDRLADGGIPRDWLIQ